MKTRSSSKRKKTDRFKTYKIVGRILIRGRWVNVYKTRRGKLYYVQEPSRNRKYLSKEEKKRVRPHKERPYFLTYDQETKTYPPKRGEKKKAKKKKTKKRGR